MRIIFIFLLAYANSCPAQQQAILDTAKFFDPFPDTAAEHRKQFIAIYNPQYATLFDNNFQIYASEKEVREFLAANKEEIKKDKLLIIIDNKTTFTHITSVIKLLKELEITNYRVVNVKDYPKAARVESFIITVQEKNMLVELSGEVESITDLEKYINTHRSDIGNKPIRIRAAKNLPFEKVAKVIEVLKKSNLSKYSLDAL